MTVTTWILGKRGVGEFQAGEPERAALLGLGHVVRATPLAGGKVRLHALNLVGTVQVGPVRLVIQPPAISREVLLGLILRYGAPVLASAQVAADPDPDLLAVLAKALCLRVRKLLGLGLRHEYHWREARLQEVRGEILFERWLGPTHPEDARRPPCRHRERILDMLEHRVLRGILDRLAHTACLPQHLRREAASLARRFPSVPPSTLTLEDAQECRRTGLFSAYAPSLDLAQILIAGFTGTEIGDLRGLGFLVDVDRLFECWLRKEIERHISGLWRVSQSSFRLATGWAAGQRPVVRRPDITVVGPTGATEFIVDAKNKRVEPQGLPGRDDLHQLLAYMAGLGCRKGLLVGASERRGEVPSRDRWTVQWGPHGDAEIGRIGLPTGGTMVGLEASVKTLTHWIEEDLGARVPPARSSGALVQ